MSAYSMERYFRRSSMDEEERREEAEEKDELLTWERVEADAIGEIY